MPNFGLVIASTIFLTVSMVWSEFMLLMQFAGLLRIVLNNSAFIFSVSATVTILLSAYILIQQNKSDNKKAPDFSGAVTI